MRKRIVCVYVFMRIRMHVFVRSLEKTGVIVCMKEREREEKCLELWFIQLPVIHEYCCNEPYCCNVLRCCNCCGNIYKIVFVLNVSVVLKVCFQTTQLGKRLLLKTNDSNFDLIICSFFRAFIGRKSCLFRRRRS